MDQLASTSGKSDEGETFALSFAERLGKLLSLFQPVMHDTEEFWFPGKPPAVVLLGNLGGAFAIGFRTLSVRDRRTVAERVEDGMTGGADYLGTAVATGFMEALIHKAEADDIWPEVEATLGPLSRNFAAAYRNDPVHLPAS